MSVFGYCRISTPSQNIERQVRNIAAAYPTAHIIREIYTGTACQGRKELDKLLHAVQPGDTIVFDSVSRMSRSADEGCALYRELYNRGVNLCFLKEPHINTDTYRQALQRQPGAAPQTGSDATDRFVCGIMDALNRYTADLAAEQICLAFAQAQKEVDDLHQRTREGLMTARLNGKQVGRKKGVGFETKKAREAKQIIRTHCKTFGGTLDDAECMKLTGLARNTYYKYKRQIRAELIAEQDLPKGASIFYEPPKSF